ncbi:MAG: site-specific integrase [Nakamurella sp.]
MASMRTRRRSDGSVSYAVLFRENGSGKQTSLTYDDKSEAERMRRVIDANGGDLGAALAVMAASKRHSPTVATVVSEHIDLLTGVSPGQVTRYRSQLRMHLSGVLGSTPIEAVGLRQIAGWIREMQAKGLAPKTIANVHGLLSAAMKTAMRLGYRADNPCHGVKLPKASIVSDEMCLLSSAEVGLILVHLSERYRPLVRFLVGTGLRWGEATALQIGDVVLDGATPSVRVLRAWKRGGDGRPYVGVPKTKRSRRTVSLPESLVVDLRAVTAGRRPDEFVFVNAYGGPVLNATFWPKHWSKAIARAQNPVGPDGLPDAAAPRLTKSPRIHDLRHTHASWLIAQGTDLFVVQRRLGHESITTTMDRYSHLLPEQQLSAAAAAGRALEGL